MVTKIVKLFKMDHEEWKEIKVARESSWMHTGECMLLWKLYLHRRLPSLRSITILQSLRRYFITTNRLTLWIIYTCYSLRQVFFLWLRLFSTMKRIYSSVIICICKPYCSAFPAWVTQQTKTCSSSFLGICLLLLRREAFIPSSNKLSQLFNFTILRCWAYLSYKLKVFSM